MNRERSISVALTAYRRGIASRIYLFLVTSVLAIVACTSAANAQKTMCQNGICVRIDSVYATGSTIRARVIRLSQPLKPYATHYNVTVEGGSLIHVHIGGPPDLLVELHKGQRKFTVQACYKDCNACRSTCSKIASFSDELAPPPPPSAPAPKPATSAYLLDAYVNASTRMAKNDVDIYDGPGGQFKIIGMMRKGAAAMVLQRHQDGWLKLRLLTGRTTGWVAEDHLTTARR